MYCIVVNLFITLHRDSETHSLQARNRRYQSYIKKISGFTKTVQTDMNRKAITTTSAALAAVVALSQPAAAQDPAATSATQEPLDTVVGSTYQDLDELVVEAKRPVIQSDGAKLTYNADEDQTSKGSNVLEMLRKVPMVSVDGQDNIRINGSSNFKIYVNGKEEPFMSANYQRILKAMPAEAVSKVEVITEPGAKYDAEGTGGILNLVTERKQRNDGYFGSVNLSGGTNMMSANVYGGLKKDRVIANISANYADNFIKNQHNLSDIETEYLNDPVNHLRRTMMDMRIHFKFYGVEGALSWEPTDRDLFTLGMNGQIVDVTNNRAKTRLSTEMFDDKMQKVYSFSQGADISMKMPNISTNASYQHTFNEAGQKLILSYLYNFGKNNTDILYIYDDMAGISFSERMQRNANKQYNRENTAQVDYINPFADGKHTLEAGGKAVWRHNDANGVTSSGNEETEMKQLDATRSDIIQFQDIYAGYLSYTGTFSPLTITAGIRYEHTHMGIDFLKGSTPNFKTNLNDFVPNAALTYMFSPMQNLRLAYQMRISRPTIDQTNPYEMEMGIGIIRSGNPDLDSERSNKVSLTYTHFAGAIGGNIGVEYSRVNNAISSYTYLKDGYIYDTYANIGHNQTAALTGFLTWSGVPKLRVNLNGRLQYVDMKSKNPDLSNHGWDLNYGASADYELPCKLNVSAYGGQQTKQHNLQGWWSGWYYYGIGVSRKFLKDNSLTVSVNAQNFLQKYTTFKSYSHTDSMTTHSRYRNEQWAVNISVGWDFGSKKESVKRTAADISNDDKADVQSGNKSGF